MNKLFLDDVRNPIVHDWTVVRNYDECVKALQEKQWDIISLDHDLADQHYPNSGYNEPYTEKTGFDLVKWLVENNKWPTVHINVHSWNPSGRMNMYDFLINFAPCGLIVTCDRWSPVLWGG